MIEASISEYFFWPSGFPQQNICGDFWPSLFRGKHTEDVLAGIKTPLTQAKRMRKPGAMQDWWNLPDHFLAMWYVGGGATASRHRSPLQTSAEESTVGPEDVFYVDPSALRVCPFHCHSPSVFSFFRRDFATSTDDDSVLHHQSEVAMLCHCVQIQENDLSQKCEGCLPWSGFRKPVAFFVFSW